MKQIENNKNNIKSTNKKYTKLMFTHLLVLQRFIDDDSFFFFNSHFIFFVYLNLNKIII